MKKDEFHKKYQNYSYMSPMKMHYSNFNESKIKVKHFLDNQSGWLSELKLRVKKKILNYFQLKKLRCLI